MWITGATSHRILERHIEWDGHTDRHAAAQLVLAGLNGKFDETCELNWCVSWLEPQTNFVELRFERAILRCPIAPGEAIEVLDRDHRRLGGMPVAETGGAVTSAQAFYLEWEDFAQSVRNRQQSSMSANSCLLVAEIMDELLER